MRPLPSPAMARVFSGIQPTGEVHLGNYLGAVRRWVATQHDDDAIYCIVDLHALTIPKDPAELRAKTLELTQILVAAGLDPDVVTLFAQSQVPEHAELGWVMECTAAFGELRRMVQFKDKSDRADFVSAGPVHLPGAAGRRHPALRHRRGAGGRRPAPAPGAGPRPGHPVQQPLRRDLRGAGPRHPAGGGPGHGPAGARAQDVQVGRLAPGHGAGARRARRSSSASSGGR